MILLLPLLAFLFASLLVAAAALALSPNAASAIEQRLGEVTGVPMNRAEEAAYGKAVVDTLKRLGNIAPRSAKEMGKLKQRLVVAGSAPDARRRLRHPHRVALGRFALFASRYQAPRLWWPFGLHGGYVVQQVLARRPNAGDRIRWDAGALAPSWSASKPVSSRCGIQRSATSWPSPPDILSELRLINLEMRPAQPAHALANSPNARA